MKLGKMRYRVTIESLTTQTDNDGFTTETFVPFATVWADITPVSSKEYFSSEQTLDEVTSKIYVRYISGINTLMRVKYGERIFDIISILSDQRQGVTTIMAKEVL